MSAEVLIYQFQSLCRERIRWSINLELTKNWSGGIGLYLVDLVNFLAQEKVWKQTLVST